MKPKPKFERPIQLADVELYRFISVQFTSWLWVIVGNWQIFLFSEDFRKAARRIG